MQHIMHQKTAIPLATCRGIATFADAGILGFFFAMGRRQEKKGPRIRTHEEWQKFLEEKQRELDKLSRN